MKASILLMTAAVLAMLVLGAGCERKIINEQGDDQTSLNSCFTCHGEEGTLLAAKGEWQNSIHASGNSVDYTNRGGASCPQCHDHQGFLDYISTGEVNAPYDMVSAIHCFTCHAPHTRGNLSLRIDEPYTLANGDVFDHGSANLCANCHHSSTSVDVIVDNYEITSSRFGPHHGPQGDLVNGSGGYEFDGYEYGNTGHANNFDNTACIGCHMGNPEMHSGYKVGGHSFNMVDEESGENLAETCQGCHPEAEDYDYDGIQTEVTDLMEQLELLLQDAGIASSTGSAVEGTYADANLVGAFWNFKTVEEDRSGGVHNPEYIKDLLESSIEYMQGLGAKK